MLLVQRRNSYAYGDFILGKYEPADNDRLLVLFNGMTVDEKAIIATMNFNNMWYHMWIGIQPRWAVLSTCNHRFFMTFHGDRGKTRLLNLISSSTNSSRIWSTPKGRKECGESLLQCAVREFTEETLLPKDGNYQVLPQLEHKYSHVADNICYAVITYVGLTYTFGDATTQPIHNPRVDATNHWQIYEVSDIRWMTLEDMKHTAGAERIYPQAKIIFKKFRGFQKSMYRFKGEKNNLVEEALGEAHDEELDA
jgi:ADP-ribose pyrophosphatase YjhB (NUDIX family)